MTLQRNSNRRTYLRIAHQEDKAMMYVVRNRYKESLKPADFPKVNKLIDEGIIPATAGIGL